jgi:hypothetical protein
MTALGGGHTRALSSKSVSSANNFKTDKIYELLKIRIKTLNGGEEERV